MSIQKEALFSESVCAHQLKNIESVSLGQNLRLCICNKLPSDPSADADIWIALWILQEMRACLHFFFMRAPLFRCMHAESCLTLCNPMDCSPPGSSVHRTFPGNPLGLPFPSPGALSNPGVEPTSPASSCIDWQADSLPLHHLGSPSLRRCFLIMVS